MTITEYAILVFHSPPDFSDPTIASLFQRLSEWQSNCSGFPLSFYTDAEDPRRVHLVTGWESVEAHEAWIRSERNQTLLLLFGPCLDMSKLRMVHLDMDFTITTDEEMVVERYVGPVLEEADDRIRFVARGGEGDHVVERWALRRVAFY